MKCYAKVSFVVVVLTSSFLSVSPTIEHSVGLEQSTGKDVHFYILTKHSDKLVSEHKIIFFSGQKSCSLHSV